MTTCPACGSEVDRNAAKCLSCGTQLAGGTAQMGAVADAKSAAAVPQEIGPAAQPSLVVVKGPDTGERFTLAGDTVSIGRDPESDIFLNDVTVSREHAVVSLEGDGVTVADRGSLNGTYVNGSIVEQAPLADGDHVQIGRFLLVFFAGEQGGS
jgi:pSer/pThr/pTyr-binding forkhead associated (FHA) protein